MRNPRWWFRLLQETIVAELDLERLGKTWSLGVFAMREQKAVVRIIMFFCLSFGKIFVIVLLRLYWSHWRLNFSTLVPIYRRTQTHSLGRRNFRALWNRERLRPHMIIPAITDGHSKLFENRHGPLFIILREFFPEALRRLGCPLREERRAPHFHLIPGSQQSSGVEDHGLM